MKKIIEFAHVGLQKTGSTWLQKDLFSKHPDLTVLGSTAKNENLTKVRPVLFDFLDPNFNKENFLQQFNSLQDLFPEKSINGISDENLSGHIYTGKNSVVIADNLYDIFGDLKIILILRNPVTYIQSAYFQRIKHGSNMSFEKFLQDTTIQKFFPNKFDYLSLINLYKERFTELLVLPYELLKDDPQLFTDYICDFLSVSRYKIKENEKINPRFPYIMQEASRYANHIDRMLWKRKRFLFKIIKMINPIFKNFPKMKQITKEELERVSKLQLRKENFEIWDGELAKYNYFQTEDF